MQRTASLQQKTQRCVCKLVQMHRCLPTQRMGQRAYTADQPAQISVPRGHVLVGEAGCDIKHDDGTLPMDVVAIPQASKLLLPCSHSNQSVATYSMSLFASLPTPQLASTGALGMLQECSCPQCLAVEHSL